jgi:hypothetical protein
MEDANYMNEGLFQRFMDDLPGLSWITDGQNVLKYANKCFFETFNLLPDIIDKTLGDFWAGHCAKCAPQ